MKIYIVDNSNINIVKTIYKNNYKILKPGIVLKCIVYKYSNIYLYTKNKLINIFFLTSKKKIKKLKTNTYIGSSLNTGIILNKKFNPVASKIYGVLNSDILTYKNNINLKIHFISNEKL